VVPRLPGAGSGADAAAGGVGVRVVEHVAGSACRARRDRWADEPVIMPLSFLLSGWRVLLSSPTTQPAGMSGDAPTSQSGVMSRRNW
jgi:hypothetical protein